MNNSLHKKNPDEYFQNRWNYCWEYKKMNNYIIKNTEEYFQKTYSGWLGKIIGIRLGSPIESLAYDKIKGQYGFIDRYVQDYNDYAADDDSNGPLFFIRALLDFPQMKGNITSKEMGETWLNYVCNGHGFFWWGGYGISTEQTAYKNLKNGIEAPLSGAIKQNGHTIAEQIGGQIFIDTWGFVNPANPLKAADLAEKMITVSHDGEGLYGGRFIVAAISEAYIAKSIDEILDAGLSVIPKDCEYRKIVNAIRNFYQSDNKKDWESCYRFIYENFGYDKYPGVCHIIPNSAIIVLSLLYGRGDYNQSQYICNSCGWDTDCNAGNIGAILGVYKGIETIDNKLIEPIKDLLIASSSIGYLNINTISETAEMFARIGCSLASVEVPSCWKKRENKYKKYYHFEMNHSTNALRCDDTMLMTTGNKVLQLMGKGTLSYKTYYFGKDFTDSRYDPSFSPLIYPGETFGFTLKNITGGPIKVKSFYNNSHTNKEVESTLITIQENEIVTISQRVKPGDDLINNIGLIFTTDVKVLIDSFYIDGKVDYILDYSKEYEDVFSSCFGPHKERSQFSFSAGYWEYNENMLVGSCTTDGETFTGEYTLSNYELKTSLIPECGTKHLINFRSQGLCRYYGFGLWGKNKVALVKKEVNDFIVIKVLDYKWTYGSEYKIDIKIEADKIKAFINEEEILEVSDNSYLSGCYGFSILDNSRCRFGNISIKEY